MISTMNDEKFKYRILFTGEFINKESGKIESYSMGNFSNVETLPGFIHYEEENLQDILNENMEVSIINHHRMKPYSNIEGLKKFVMANFDSPSVIKAFDEFFERVEY